MMCMTKHSHVFVALSQAHTCVAPWWHPVQSDGRRRKEGDYTTIHSTLSAMSWTVQLQRPSGAAMIRRPCPLLLQPLGILHHVLMRNTTRYSRPSMWKQERGNNTREGENAARLSGSKH